MQTVWLPGLSGSTQAFIRATYGALLFLTLAITLPQARRFFLSERWGGYAKSSRFVDLVQNPWVLPLLMSLWFLCAGLLIVGRYTVTASFVSLLLGWYFFIAMRWRGVLRGMGAPGFMTFWLAACVFFLEFSFHHDVSGRMRTAALLAFRVDFAVIMLCAGTYKILAGYPRNHGMEFGLVNPWWGYWGRLYRRLSPDCWLLRTLNHLAYTLEIAAGLLMLVPSLSVLGALLIVLSFAFIVTQIRLGFLCEMVMLAAFLYVPEGHAVDKWLTALVGGTQNPSGPPCPWWLSSTLTGMLVAYILLLPLAKVGQYYNLLRRKALPALLQAALDRYTNLFGIIIWRVFSADHTNFFTRIYTQEHATGKRLPYVESGGISKGCRYLHVGEFICLVSLFTTLKYYPSNSALFVDRLLRYARTLRCEPGFEIVFEYVSIRKDAGRFSEATVAEYLVDPRAGTVVERLLDESGSARASDQASPIHEAGRPGSYAPALA